MDDLEKALTEIKKEAIGKMNARLRDEYLDRDMLKFNAELKKEHFNTNQKVQGMMKGNTMRRLAEIPFQVYDYYTKIYGPDYFRDMKNIKKHPQFLVVDRV
jgi:hypothetical protein